MATKTQPLIFGLYLHLFRQMLGRRCGAAAVVAAVVVAAVVVATVVVATVVVWQLLWPQRVMSNQKLAG